MIYRILNAKGSEMPLSVYFQFAQSYNIIPFLVYEYGYKTFAELSVHFLIFTAFLTKAPILNNYHETFAINRFCASLKCSLCSTCL